MNLTKKSRLISLLLTSLFGPLGVLYSSIAGALLLVLLAIITAPFGGWLLVWLLAIGVGDHCTYKHNQSVDLLAKR